MGRKVRCLEGRRPRGPCCIVRILERLGILERGRSCFFLHHLDLASKPGLKPRVDGSAFSPLETWRISAVENATLNKNANQTRLATMLHSKGHTKWNGSRNTCKVSDFLELVPRSCWLSPITNSLMDIYNILETIYIYIYKL